MKKYLESEPFWPTFVLSSESFCNLWNQYIYYIFDSDFYLNDSSVIHFNQACQKKSERFAFGLFQLRAPCGAWSRAAHGEVAAQRSLIHKCMAHFTSLLQSKYFTMATAITSLGASNISFYQKFFNIPPWQIPNPCYNNQVLTTQPHIWGSSRVAKGDRL